MQCSERSRASSGYISSIIFLLNPNRKTATFARNIDIHCSSQILGFSDIEEWENLI